MGSTWGFFEELSGELASAGAELRKQSERIGRNAGLALAALGATPDRDGATDAPPNPELPGTRARLRELKFLEGIWKDPATGAIACAREHIGEMRCVYSFRGPLATGEFCDFRLVNGGLLGRFQWISRSLSGYVFYRLESTQRLVGGWWLASSIPDHRVPELPHVTGMVAQTWLRQPLNQVFPAWAEDFFRKLGSGKAG
jgi:hypothetical protein